MGISNIHPGHSELGIILSCYFRAGHHQHTQKKMMALIHYQIRPSSHVARGPRVC